ncbi:MAG: NAD-dependent epimerase/dehydratase family protein [Chloroflexota bacterium]|nr:NAD-dependent epimerase/dehydratase family protein [Chloroflexota bacterium]
MGSAPRPRTALVTGGAGLIGSHIVDQALAAGWQVRVLDNLQRQTHRLGKPAWIPANIDFQQGDVRHRRVWQRALDGIDVVFHQAAYGGYMPEIAKFIHTNGVGTALMLETIRDDQLPVRKVVVASSQAVYNEGAYACPEHGAFHGRPRLLPQLERGDFGIHCPQCQRVSEPMPTDEAAPTGGDNVYAISKLIQERLVLAWGRSTEIPVVALRYSCTFGPRQSLFNPYTGVIAIFCTRLMNDLAPVLYEDGEQSRDMIYVEDVARANLLVASDDRANGRVYNVGTGRAVTARAMATLLATRLGKAIEPVVPGEFRPGEMRALISDTRQIQALGFDTTVTLEVGLDRYLAWVAEQGTVADYFTRAERVLRRRKVVKKTIGKRSAEMLHE